LGKRAFLGAGLLELKTPALGGLKWGFSAWLAFFVFNFSGIFGGLTASPVYLLLYSVLVLLTAKSSPDMYAFYVATQLFYHKLASILMSAFHLSVVSAFCEFAVRSLVSRWFPESFSMRCNAVVFVITRNVTYCTEPHLYGRKWSSSSRLDAFAKGCEMNYGRVGSNYIPLFGNPTHVGIYTVSLSKFEGYM
jgi:hypothetical protein